MRVVAILPMPPSGNDLWVPTKRPKSGRPDLVRSAKYANWRLETLAVAMASRAIRHEKASFDEGDVEVSAVFDAAWRVRSPATHPMLLLQSDLDNRVKALLDILQISNNERGGIGIYTNDHQVSALHAGWGAVPEGTVAVYCGRPDDDHWVRTERIPYLRAPDSVIREPGTARLREVLPHGE